MGQDTELNSKDRRAALEFAERVAAMAAEAPDAVTKSDLYKVVGSMRRRFGFSEQEKLEEIFRMIELGATTMADLVRETSFPPETVHWGTKLLEQHGLIKFQRLSLTGKGRPALLIKLVEGPSNAEGAL